MSAQADGDRWIRRFHPVSQAGTRLVCFPHAGGSASYYFPVSRALSPDIEVLAVQYPGRQDRHTEPCLDTVAELADSVVDRLRPWTDRPLALFGHSLGATLAFEVASRLEQSGTAVTALFASGRWAPSRYRNENIHLLDDSGFIEAIQELGGADTQILEDPEIRRMALPALRSDYKAAETYRYRPGPPLRCPLYTMTGENDPMVSIDEASAWGDHTTGHFELHTYSGGHFYLNAHAPRVIETISTVLTAATV